jgi:hypothetical protein
MQYGIIIIIGIMLAIYIITRRRNERRTKGDGEMRQRNQRYSRPCQKKAYTEGAQAGLNGASVKTRKAGRNPRIWKIGYREGQELRTHDEKAWDFLNE